MPHSLTLSLDRQGQYQSCALCVILINKTPINNTQPSHTTKPTLWSKMIDTMTDRHYQHQLRKNVQIEISSIRISILFKRKERLHGRSRNRMEKIKSRESDNWRVAYPHWPSRRSKHLQEYKNHFHIHKVLEVQFPSPSIIMLFASSETIA